MVLRQFPLLPPMHGDLEGWGGGVRVIWTGKILAYQINIVKELNLHLGPH